MSSCIQYCSVLFAKEITYMYMIVRYWNVKCRNSNSVARSFYFDQCLRSKEYNYRVLRVKL